MVSRSTPGHLLGFFVTAGTVAAALAVRPSAGRTIVPVPALAYLVAALISGVVFNRSAATSKAALAIGAAQWVADGFFAMVLATVLALTITVARWFLWRRSRPVARDRDWSVPGGHARAVRPGTGNPGGRQRRGRRDGARGHRTAGGGAGHAAAARPGLPGKTRPARTACPGGRARRARTERTGGQAPRRRASAPGPASTSGPGGASGPGSTPGPGGVPGAGGAPGLADRARTGERARTGRSRRGRGPRPGQAARRDGAGCRDQAVPRCQAAPRDRAVRRYQGVRRDRPVPRGEAGCQARAERPEAAGTQGAAQPTRDPGRARAA